MNGRYLLDTNIIIALFTDEHHAIAIFSMVDFKGDNHD